MYDEDDLLLISALQHLAFCERQCALIHIECAWDENRLTAEGRVLHDRTHEADSESRGDVRIVRGLRLRSLRLGLTGIADVVEFHRVSAINSFNVGTRHVVSDHIMGDAERSRSASPRSTQVTPGNEGIRIDGAPGMWRPFPVEYKRGRPKTDRCDEVQVCAQALCIEEMLGVKVASGALFYGVPHRRQDVVFDEPLRRETESLAARLHALFDSGETPPAKYEKKCKNCSIINQCLPRVAAARKNARKYIDDAISEAGIGVADSFAVEKF